MFPDDLFQGFINTYSQDDEFVEIQLPFDSLVLTSFGFQKEVKRPFPPEEVSHIGFTIIKQEVRADHVSAFVHLALCAFVHFVCICEFVVGLAFCM